jgi:DNA polymerase III delta prime subunit
MNHTIWTEKYRPSTLENYIGNDSLKQKLKQYIQNQDIPHLLFYGTAGTGKTTAAKILVKNINCDFLFINASDERGIDIIRDKIRNFAVTTGFAPLKIIVLDESDYLTPDAQAALRYVMEAHSKTTRFILTCNYVERIIQPLISRSQGVFKLTPPSKKEVALHLINILDKESISYEKNVVATLVNAYYPDIRRILGTAQNQVKDNKLELDVEEIIAQDYKLKVLDVLVSNLSDTNKINQVRQIVADSNVKDYTELYRLLFDKVTDYAPTKIAQSISAIAEGQYRDIFVADKEINFVNTLYNILNN